MATSKRPNLDTLTSVNRDGSRFFIHPSDVRGFFTRFRRVTAVLLIAIYVLLPWIPINGHPAVFLDVVNRRFHLFGVTLAVQDAWLLFFLVSGLAFLLFYVTAFMGRIWCGYACPQTVFLEHVFRRVERWLEGDAPKRRKLDAAPWTSTKVLRRGTKHAIFLVLSAAIAHVFLSYFVSIPQLWTWMTQSPTEHWSAFVFVFVTTALLYFNFSWFREQLCIVICPYGRLQSALIDDNTINVAYDFNRGEPRGKVTDPNAGDCIDCHRCINVCPTGIDIRQGLQLECIGCAACIDACDEIMVKVNRPKGLIRYASDANLEGQKNKWIRPRTVLYTALLLLGAAVALFAFSGLEQAFASATRMQGSPFYLTDDAIRNQFQVRLINKSTEPMRFSIAAESANPALETRGFETPLQLESMGETTSTFIVLLPKTAYDGPFDVRLIVTAEPGNVRIEESVEFLGPDPSLLKAAD